MAKASPKMKTEKPKSALEKPLQADLKGLFKSLAKGIGHTVNGKWEELSNDTVEGLYAIGLATQPAELAFLLIQRSITRALFDLISESACQLLADDKSLEEIEEKLNFSISIREVQLDKKFLDQPANLALLDDLKPMLQKWLERYGVENHVATTITDRLSAYFVYALNQEWRKNAKSYKTLFDILQTPFSKAGDREWAWAQYTALLMRRIKESIFDEPFSLSQIYVPLNAYYTEEVVRKDSSDDTILTDKHRRKVAISLQQELEQWLQHPNQMDAIRIISGGPGSGKSSFARIFAAETAQNGKSKVLFVPLHLIDPTKDLVDEVGRFVRDEGILIQNPLDPETPEPHLLIIFDGLDELASQGKAATETAKAFVREVEKTVEKRNLQQVKLRVLISGRELVVQENESEFRRPRQILNLLPYYVSAPEHPTQRFLKEVEEYHDPNTILKSDLRQQWWNNYGILTGKKFEGLPKELSRKDLDEITAQPLLNYLVALSFTRDKIDFNKDVNLNSIYADLVAAVHERGYEKHRTFGPIRHMKNSDFTRVLEEIGLAAWHGDGRTTTVHEIEQHCRTSGVGVMLEAFQEGAKSGVTRLLAAFFFRQHGHRTSGDPTFVFTHKSFGEYLTSLRIVRAIERVFRELEQRTNNPDGGWDERDALKHWAQICGPSAMTRYLHTFLLNEIKLRSTVIISQWQNKLVKLFSYVLRHGMPMEQLQIGSFKEAMFHSRNAEEGLLVALNACARITKQISNIEHPDQTSFGAWIKRIQGQRTGPESVLAMDCLSFLEFGSATLHMADFYSANFEYSKFTHVNMAFGCLVEANLKFTDLRSISLHQCNLEGANLEGSNLEDTNCRGINFHGANLQGTNLKGADFERANLKGANLKGANLEGAKHLERALRGTVKKSKDGSDGQGKAAREPEEAGGHVESAGSAAGQGRII